MFSPRPSPTNTAKRFLVTNTGVADTDVAEVEVADTKEVVDLDVLTPEEDSEDNQQLSTSAMIGRIFLFSAPTEDRPFDGEPAYDAAFLKRLKRQADKLLRLNQFDSVLKVVVSTPAELATTRLNALADVAFNIVPLRVGGMGGQVREYITAHLMTFGNKQIVFGEVYARQYYIDPQLNGGKVYQGGAEIDSSMINIARALVHEVTTHAYGVLLNDLLQVPYDPTDETGYAAHVPSNVYCIHHPNTYPSRIIPEDSDRYQKLDRWEVILSPAKRNITTLLSFAAEFYRLRFVDDILRLSKIPTQDMGEMALFFLPATDKRYRELVRRTLVGRLTSLGKYQP